MPTYYDSRITTCIFAHTLHIHPLPIPQTRHACTEKKRQEEAKNAPLACTPTFSKRAFATSIKVHLSRHLMDCRVIPISSNFYHSIGNGVGYSRGLQAYRGFE